MARSRQRKTKDINLDSGVNRLTLEGALTAASIGLLIALVLQQEAQASMGGDESIKNVRPNWNITRGLPSDISSDKITTDEVVLSAARQLPSIPEIAISAPKESVAGYSVDLPLTNYTVTSGSLFSPPIPGTVQPELRDSAAYYSTLVNAGIITPNEAREALNYDEVFGAGEIRVPANIAGSALNPAEGGRPAEEEE